MWDRIMRERIREAVTETINGLYKCGVIDRVTRRNIEKLCLIQSESGSIGEFVQCERINSSEMGARQEKTNGCIL